MSTAPRNPRRLSVSGVEPAGEAVTIHYQEKAIPALAGETVAAALTAAGRLDLRRTRAGAPRGLFCGMGVCFECLVEIDGRPGQRACLAKVRDGMRVKPQAHEGPVPAADAPPLGHAPAGQVPVVEAEVLVVGAGPAGLAAAEAAASLDCRVTMLDERPEPGGQYFKQLAPSHRFATRGTEDRQFASGRVLIARARAAGVEIVPEATVWGAFAGADGTPEIGVIRDGRATRYRARQLIVAAGAYERPFPVPGWTLPGVMTTGAAQTLARAYRVAPGTRVLLAGNGPLNMQVACELAAGGVEVVAVAEAAARPGPARAGDALTALARAPDLVCDGLGYLAALRLRGVPVRYRHALARVDGEGRVERATLVGIDGNGRPRAGTEREYAVDAVCVGYGFLSSVEITRLLGCRHRFDSHGLGGLAVEQAADGATSVAGVFAVGDGGAIGGARAALAQGTLAGLAAARNLGRDGAASAARDRAARAALARALSFQRALWRLFEAPPLFEGFVADDVLVCRCEEVTAGALRRHVASGTAEIGALKRLTRAGMGRCQGRYCAAYVARLCAEAAGRTPDEFAFFAPRLPVKPVPAVALAAEKPEWADYVPQTAPARREPSPDVPGPERAADVIVIGAGILGSCAAYFLAGDGVDVVQLERGQPNGEASGANAGSLHVQLLAYDFGLQARTGGIAAEMLPLQRESARMWPALAADMGCDLEIKITGGLMVAEDVVRLAHLERKAALERSFGTPVEVIDRAELRRLAPAVSDRLVGAAWCPEEGKINPLLATPAVLAGAARRGARLFAETEVRRIEREGGAFVVHTNRGAFRAPKVLNACGAWSKGVAAMLGVELPIHAAPIQMIVTEPAPPLVEQLLAYADRHLTMKQAANGNLIIGGGWFADIDARTRHPRVLVDSLEGNLWVAARVLPALASVHVIRSWAAVNVNIDGAPILGQVPGIPGFFHAIGVNGVTLGPIIGRITAESMRTGRTSPAIERFTLARFG